MSKFSKPSPQIKLLMLMLGQIHKEIQEIKHQMDKDKKEILLWLQGSRAAK